MAVEVNGIRYLTANEVVAEVGVSRPTLWRWRQQGKVPAGHRYRNRQVIFTLEEVEAIREFAHRVEPIEGISLDQFDLFDDIGNKQGKRT